ncbi:hypothetical protein ACQCN2_07890 [Brevibacillus ginsengisoli]|uniref:hypothetical protein n=1 Tax=Brevibacillus ginsengisoli TaxID=363854 RepID=UPI003CF519E3
MALINQHFSKIFVSLLFFTAAFLILSPPVFSCSCAPHPPPSKALQNSEAVFTGTVKEITQVPKGYQVLFEVNHAWKGVNYSQVAVSTSMGDGGGDCGYSFTKGATYLVYANENTMNRVQEGLVTTSCSRTALLSEAKEDLEALGAGKTPYTQRTLMSMSYHLYILTMIGTLLVTGFLPRTRRDFPD